MLKKAFSVCFTVIVNSNQFDSTIH